MARSIARVALMVSWGFLFVLGIVVLLTAIEGKHTPIRWWDWLILVITCVIGTYSGFIIVNLASEENRRR